MNDCISIVVKSVGSAVGMVDEERIESVMVLMKLVEGYVR